MYFLSSKPPITIISFITYYWNGTGTEAQKIHEVKNPYIFVYKPFWRVKHLLCCWYSVYFGIRSRNPLNSRYPSSVLLSFLLPISLAIIPNDSDCDRLNRQSHFWSRSFEHLQTFVAFVVFLSRFIPFKVLDLPSFKFPRFWVSQTKFLVPLFHSFLCSAQLSKFSNLQARHF